MAEGRPIGKRARESGAAKLSDGELGGVRGGSTGSNAPAAAGREAGQTQEPGPIRTRSGVVIDFSDDP